MAASWGPAPQPIRAAGIREILKPRSVALVGASPRNIELVENLQRHGTRAIGITPARSGVGDMKCTASVADLDFVPDLGVLAVSPARVEKYIADLFERGTRAFVVPGLGAEAGEQGRSVAARLAAWSGETNAAILGPNCMGVATPSAASAWLGTLPPSFRAGNVGVVSQSGSIADAFVALGPRLGFSAVLSTGAEISRDAADWIAALARDDSTAVIAVFLETVRRTAAFREALDMAAEAGKPVVALKVGRTDKSRRTALAHTGAIVGSHAACQAMLRTHGALEVADLPEMIDLLDVLSRPSRPRGQRIGAVTESGAEAGLLADHAEPHGFSFPDLADDQKAQLADAYPLLPLDNPLDPWAQGEASRAFTDAIGALAASGNYDILLAQIDLSRFRGATEQAWCRASVRALAEARDRTGTFAAVTTVHQVDPPDELAEFAAESGVSLLRGVGAGLTAIARAAAWEPVRAPRRDATAKSPRDGAVLDPRLESLLNQAQGALSESDSSAILAAFGVAFAPAVLAETPEHAASAMEQLGGPVVVKVDGVAHKARVNGVRLGITSPAQAQAAAREMGGRVLVARQVVADAELFCGMTRDRDYGPVFVIGRGGRGVEGNQHVTRLGPLDEATVHQMAAEARLSEWAGTLARAAVAVSDLCLRYPQISEVDINPLMVRDEEDRGLAVDALIVLAESATTERLPEPINNSSSSSRPSSCNPTQPPRRLTARQPLHQKRSSHERVHCRRDRRARRVR